MATTTTSTAITDPTRWTIAPWLYCDIAERAGVEPIGLGEIQGGVVFCPRCGRTSANHRQVLMRDGRMVAFAG